MWTKVKSSFHCNSRIYYTILLATPTRGTKISTSTNWGIMPGKILPNGVVNFDCEDKVPFPLAVNAGTSLDLNEFSLGLGNFLSWWWSEVLLLERDPFPSGNDGTSPGVEVLTRRFEMFSVLTVDLEAGSTVLTESVMQASNMTLAQEHCDFIFFDSDASNSVGK